MPSRAQAASTFTPHDIRACHAFALLPELNRLLRSSRFRLLTLATVWTKRFTAASVTLSSPPKQPLPELVLGFFLPMPLVERIAAACRSTRSPIAGLRSRSGFRKRIYQELKEGWLRLVTPFSLKVPTRKPAPWLGNCVGANGPSRPCRVWTKPFWQPCPPSIYWSRGLLQMLLRRSASLPRSADSICPSRSLGFPRSPSANHQLA